MNKNITYIDMDTLSNTDVELLDALDDLINSLRDFVKAPSKDNFVELYNNMQWYDALHQHPGIA